MVAPRLASGAGRAMRKQSSSCGALPELQKKAVADSHIPPRHCSGTPRTPLPTTSVAASTRRNRPPPLPESQASRRWAQQGRTNPRTQDRLTPSAITGHGCLSCSIPTSPNRPGAFKGITPRRTLVHGGPYGPERGSRNLAQQETIGKLRRWAPAGHRDGVGRNHAGGHGAAPAPECTKTTPPSACIGAKQAASRPPGRSKGGRHCVMQSSFTLRHAALRPTAANNNASWMGLPLHHDFRVWQQMRGSALLRHFPLDRAAYCAKW